MTPTPEQQQQAREIYESLPDCDFCGALCPIHTGLLLDHIATALAAERARALEVSQHRIAEFEEALREFGEHKSHCKSNERYPSPPCDCGLVAATMKESES